MKYDVGIDCRMAMHSGIGTYLKGLLREYGKSTDLLTKYQVALFGHPGELNVNGMHNESFNANIYSIREQIQYGKLTSQCRLWHAPHYNVPLQKGGAKLVVTIHDVIHWIFRDKVLSPLKKLYAGKMLKAAIHSSDHIIAVSEKTKEDIMTYFNADKNKISVIYESVAHDFIDNSEDISKEALQKKYGISDRYFLYVGLIKPHKNVHWMTKVFEKMRAKHNLEESLVVVGKKDKKYPADYEALNHVGEEDGVIHLTGIPTPDLKALYRHAEALVHPSLYEGFGLTPLEAMASNTPVIACRAGSVPEIVGPAGILISPESDQELEDALLKVLRQPQMRTELVEKGNQQWRKYSWEDTARQTQEVYERVLSL